MPAKQGTTVKGDSSVTADQRAAVEELAKLAVQNWSEYATRRLDPGDVDAVGEALWLSEGQHLVRDGLDWREREREERELVRFYHRAILALSKRAPLATPAQVFKRFGHRGRS